MIKFRFPIAILHYVRNGGTEGVLSPEFAFQNAVEKAREWALGDKPTLEQAETWVRKVIEDDDRKRAEAQKEVETV